ncbi:MAG: excinuclease ABC subunit UvrC [Candidatus Adiutrix sp.]|jgi:excinuclease ABC subunit C|nr:excinuclease ABC subunit UvrC [Candidatus Adiutrix sp.]
MELSARLEQLRRKALDLPAAPGVYLMKDGAGEILYVGKAKLLPRRAASYFQKTPATARLGLLVSLIEDFDFMVTATEKESLILEDRLIKKFRPRFNIILRDDKTYPCLRLTAEDFPRLEVVRRPGRDGSTIFGPFPSAGALRDTVRAALRLFPLRQCRRPDVKNIDRPCLNHQLGRCLGPCRPEVTPAEYQKLTEEVRLFFRGRGRELAGRLTAEMKAAAESYDYEAAARLRDRINNINKTLERQAVNRAESDLDLDVFGFHRRDGLLEGALVLVRQGAVTGCLPLEAAAGGGLGGRNEEDGEEDEEALSLLTQYYGGGGSVPEEILWPGKLSEETLKSVTGWLAALRGRGVKIQEPRRGQGLKLLDMARENARAALEERLNRLGRNQGAMAELKARLALEKVPRRLECFDLAHLSGTNAVAGLVVMEDGEWRKEDYRRFRLKQARGGDDYGGLREAVARRFGHGDWPEPDLLLIDGGRGQLAAAQAAFDDLGRPPPPLAAIAKVRQEGDIDRVFRPGRKNPADLKAGSAGLLLLARLRDEAHRYAGAYHRRLQARDFLSSPLLEIPGLGPAKRKKLLERFGSLESLAQAEETEIRAAAALKPETAAELKKSLAERPRPE